MQTLKPIQIVVVFCLLTTGCALFGKKNHPTVRFHEQVSQHLPENHILPVDLPAQGIALGVAPYAALTEYDLESAELQRSDGGTRIKLIFDHHGKFVLDEVTTRMRGQRIVVFLNQKPVTAWFVHRRIDDGTFLLEGDFTEEEAIQLVEWINKKRR